MRNATTAAATHRVNAYRSTELPREATPEALLRLQRQAGNQAVARLLLRDFRMYQPESMLALQQTAGNNAVLATFPLGAPATNGAAPWPALGLQRQPEPKAPPKPGKTGGKTAPKDVTAGKDIKPAKTVKPAKPKRADYDDVIGSLGVLITNNEKRAERAAVYLPLGQSVARLAHQKWSTAGRNYKSAYDTYQAIINKASEHAKDRNELAKVLIGIGIGVGVGLLTTATMGAFLAVEAIPLALEVMAGAAGETAEAGASKVVDQILAPPKLRADAGVDPYALTMSQYEKIVKIYDGVLDVGVQSVSLPKFLRTLEAMRGQARLLRAGAQADTTWEKLVAGLAAARKAETELATVNYPIPAANELMTELNKKPVDTELEFERDIWLAWMATLGPDEESGKGGHNVDAIEEDIIEDHLVAIGVLGTNGIIGINTQVSDDDDEEAAAIDKATVEWGKLYYGKYLPMMNR